MDIFAKLSEANRVWHDKQDGASDEQIHRLESVSPIQLPTELIDLLRFSNGGEAELALAPLLVVIDTVDEIEDGFRDEFLRAEFAGFLFFGGNGGLERLALDTRAEKPPFPIVAIDPISGPESAQTIAADFASFIEAIGHQYSDADAD